MIKEFTLGAVKWSVKIDNDYLAEINALGYACPNETVLRLADFHKGKELPYDLIDQTVYHEVVHAILATMGWSELYDNEEFVQAFSLLLHQFEKTKK